MIGWSQYQLNSDLLFVSITDNVFDLTNKLESPSPSLTPVLFFSAEHGPPRGDGVAPANSRRSRGVLHLQ